jgi:PAS domain S-box-containing protein
MDIRLDVSSCDREPIHTPAAIQPHGVLLVARASDGKMVFASANSARILGVEPAAIFQQTLLKLVGEEAMAMLEAALGGVEHVARNIPVTRIPVSGEARFAMTAHRSGDLVSLELEPQSQPQPAETAFQMERAMQALSKPASLDELCTGIPPLVRSLTGHGRVMVYRFLPDGGGQVVAEDVEAGMDRFLGLHYPASDIPRQARALYLRKRLTMIPDVGYTPVPILRNPDFEDDQPLDMTYCGLRSVSPLHIEYQQNMGVGASLGISLVHHDELWGLVICHHRTVKWVPPETRALCQLIGQLLSMGIADKQQARDDVERLEKIEILGSLREALEAERPVADTLFDCSRELLALTASDGALIRIGARVGLIGQTPPLNEALKLMAAFYPERPEELWCTDDVGTMRPEFAHLAGVASGAMVTPIGGPGDGILWLRGERVRTLRWAGRPDAAKELSADGLRLSPRKSFVVWEEEQRGRSLSWTPSERYAASGLQSRVTQQLLSQIAAEEASRKSAIETAVRAALVEANTRVELAIDGAGIGIWDWDLATDKFICNPRIYSLHGLPVQEGVAPGLEFWMQNIHPDDVARLRETLRNATEHVMPYETEFRVLWEDGSEHHIQATGQVIRDESGRAVRMVGANWDITARKEAEEALRESHQREQLILGVKEYAMLMLDREGRVTSWNEGAQRIQGYTADEIIGCHFSKFYPPEALAEGKPERELEIATRLGSYEEEGWRVRKDGTQFWAAVLVTALFDRNGQLRGFGKVTRDITQRKLAEESAKQARIDAEVANRAKSDFLANMSHEVRTPVNAIIGMAHLALRANPTAQQRGYLTKIETAAQTLLGIMNGILDFSKIEAGKMTLEHIVFSLQDVLKDLRDIVGHRAEQKGLPILFSVSPEVPWSLVGDKLRLGQVLINLVNNAIKFTDRGEIKVRVEPVDGPRKEEGPGKADGERQTLRFSVSDTGIGMTPQQMANLFQAFNQADTSFTRKYGGTGLGLAISRQLAELMGGTITVESEYGVGSTFHFTATFGIAAQGSSPPGARSEGSSSSQGAASPSSALNPVSLVGRRVLLVEDNELNRDLAVELLADLGIVVTVAINGQEAVEKVRAHPFDLVLMDIQMPLMDGITATTLIRAQEQFRNLPILAMTAHAMSGDRQRSLDAGMNDHLDKPVNPHKLTEALVRWMPAIPALDLDRPQENSDADSQDEDLPAELPPFNLPAALARTNGKPRLLRKLILGFREEYADLPALLRKLLASQRDEDATRLMHSFKSIAAMLEATDLASAAVALETALQSGQRESVSALIDRLERLLAPAVAAASRLDRRMRQQPAREPVPGIRPVILAIDDQRAILDFLAETFHDDYEVLLAAGGEAGLEIAAQRLPEIILLDIHMPGIDGYEVFRRMKQDARTQDIPVIFVTGSGDVGSETKGLDLGAVDFVTKPMNAAAVRARVKNHVKFKRTQAEVLRLRAKEYLDDMVNELERSAAKDRARDLELQLKDNFLSHVSHELRSPLSSIYNYATLIADRVAGEINEQQANYLQILLLNVAQLKSMIDDLLEATRMGSGKLEVKPQNASLEEALAYSIHTLQGTADARCITLSSHLAEGLPESYADPTRLRQILTILLDNAVKFTPDGGKVSVKVGVYPEKDNFLVVEVADTGCGIAPGLTETIFDRLYQVPGSQPTGRSGLGLGLHIARELVRRQGGEIWVKSTLGEGSRFYFTVPTIARAEAAPASDPRKLAAPQGRPA